MSSPPVDVVVAIALAAGCGTVLLLGLVMTALVMRTISLRLTALQEVLHSVGAITDPLTGRMDGIARNVGTLREAATALSHVLASRTGAADVTH